MADFQEPMLVRDGVLDYYHPLHKLTRLQWWILVILNINFLIVGQTAAVLLGRYYYDKGGNSKWMATLVQTAAFPILVIPYVFLRSEDEAPPSTASPPSVLTLAMLYFIIGALIAVDNMMYSVALLYLSASTYSLACATQLAFNAVFSFFINRQKFTPLILKSVVLLSLSAVLLALNDGSGEPLGVSKTKYIFGILTALLASALYSLLMSLMQLSFENILKKETFAVVLEMQIYTSVVATCVSIAGLLVSGEWWNLPVEMHSFSAGKVSYVMTLVGTAVAWQVCSVGVISLIYLVSSLFSNVISTLSLVVAPVAALIIFHDKMNGMKIISMLLAFWGFSSYIYQNYCDDREARRNLGNSNDLGEV